MACPMARLSVTDDFRNLDSHFYLAMTTQPQDLTPPACTPLAADPAMATAL